MVRKTLRTGVHGVVVVALLGGAGCSSFDRAWEEAAGLSARAAEADRPLAGRWKGTWRSEKTGHQGKLRAVVRHTGGRTYRARFHATYGGLFPFEYTVEELTVTGSNGATRFEGSADLGLFVGVYEYEGKVDNGKWRSTYHTEGDRGIFRMERVRGEASASGKQ